MHFLTRFELFPKLYNYREEQVLMNNVYKKCVYFKKALKSIKTH